MKHVHQTLIPDLNWLTFELKQRCDPILDIILEAFDFQLLEIFDNIYSKLFKEALDLYLLLKDLLERTACF